MSTNGGCGSIQRCFPMWGFSPGEFFKPAKSFDVTLILSGKRMSCCFQVVELYFMSRTIKTPFRYNGDPPYGLRGYLDDRVNRIIGFALVRQIREIPGNCRSPKLMRDYVDSCTGDLLVMIRMWFSSSPWYQMEASIVPCWPPMEWQSSLVLRLPSMLTLESEPSLLWRTWRMMDLGLTWPTPSARTTQVRLLLQGLWILFLQWRFVTFHFL